MLAKEENYLKQKKQQQCSTRSPLPLILLDKVCLKNIYNIITRLNLVYLIQNYYTKTYVQSFSE